MPAHLSVVDGAVTLEREGQAQPADVNVALLAGDRLRTERGRAEILFGDGSALDLDNDTSVDLLSESLIRLRAGRLRLSITRVSNEVEYRVDAAGCSALIHSAGDFSVSISEARRTLPEADLAVFRGTAELENAHGRTLVRAGQHAWARIDAEPSSAASFNSTAADDFDHWVEDQRDARTGTTSSQYLPSEMRTYGGAFDAYGTLGHRAVVRHGLVSAGGRRLAAVQRRLLVGLRLVRVVLGRADRLVVAHAPLRPLGRVVRPLVLGAWPSVGAGVGVVGDEPGYVGWCPLGVDGRPVGWFNGERARRAARLDDGHRESVQRGERTRHGRAAAAHGESRRIARSPSERPRRSCPPRDRAPASRSTRPRRRGVAASRGWTSGSHRDRRDPARSTDAPLVPAARAMRETDAPAAGDAATATQDRTPSWQARPGEPRPAPTVARPGFWSDPPSSPSRAQPRPSDGATQSGPDRAHVPGAL